MAKFNIKEFVQKTFARIRFLIKFAAILALLVIVEDAGGTKMVIFVLMAFVLALIWDNADFVREWFIDFIMKMVR